jgi:hypothetical protein
MNRQSQGYPRNESERVLRQASYKRGTMEPLPFPLMSKASSHWLYLVEMILFLGPEEAFDLFDFLFAHRNLLAALSAEIAERHCANQG